jgi:predicted dehydrogenase
MKNQVKWGVIGSGGIAKRRTIPEGIIPAQNSKLISVYDINPEVNASVADEFNALEVKSIEELLNSGIDAVYVASPVNVHMEQVIKCAKAGKHVLCEKPLGLAIDEAREMINTCKSEGVLLGTGFMMRFLAQHQYVLKLINEGHLGTPVFGRAQLSCWYPPIEGAWRQDPSTGGGGSLVDMGSHCIDLLQMFFGKILRVSCFINNNVHSYKSEDCAVVSLYFENGAFATVDTFFCIPDNSSKNALEIYGSRGSIIANGTLGQGAYGNMTAYLENDFAGYDAQQARQNGKGLVIDPEPVNTYLAEIEEFGNAIIYKREPANNHTIGMQSMNVIAACYESAKTGRIIEVNY